MVQSAHFAAAWAPVVANLSRPVQNQFVLEQGGYVTGKVVDGDGKPLARASVGWVVPVRSDGQLDETLELSSMTATGEDGTFRLGPLPQGEFQITAVAEGSTYRIGKSLAKANQQGVVIAVKEPSS